MRLRENFSAIPRRRPVPLQQRCTSRSEVEGDQPGCIKAEAAALEARGIEPALVTGSHTPIRSAFPPVNLATVPCCRGEAHFATSPGIRENQQPVLATAGPRAGSAIHPTLLSQAWNKPIPDWSRIIPRPRVPGRITVAGLRIQNPPSINKYEGRGEMARALSKHEVVSASNRSARRGSYVRRSDGASPGTASAARLAASAGSRRSTMLVVRGAVVPGADRIERMARAAIAS